MKKLKPLNKPRIVNHQQSILDFSYINEKIGETELCFFTKVRPLLDPQLFLVMISYN